MRICILCEYFHPDNSGGTPTVLSQLARVLHDEYGLQIEVITSRNWYRGKGKRLPALSNWDGIGIFRLNTPPSNQPRAAWRLAAGAFFTIAALAKLWTRPRPDVVFVVTNPPTAPLAALLYGRARRVPYVYLIHDLYPDLAAALGVLPRAHFLTRCLGKLQRGWLHAARRVVVIGRCMSDYLEANYQVPSGQIEVISNWSNPDEISRKSTDTPFRRHHNLSGPVILYAGNFGQHQNFDNLLDAAKQLRTRQPRATFVFVGEGAKKEAMARRVAAEKLENVRLFPFVPHEEFADLLACADISLVTLEPGAEGLGVPSKFYNILASGRPTMAIVASNSEVARVIKEEGCGVAVEQNNAVALAGALDQLLRDPEAIERFGFNARRACERRFTLRHAARQWHQVFSEVVKK